MITANPTIDFTEKDVLLYYLTGGAAVFGCIGDPENVIAANKRSLALSDDGNVYFKTTDNANTGWVAIGGGGGSGTVTNFSAGNLSPLFNSSVANPTTTPALTFAQISQLQNLFFASPNGLAGNPTFRAIATADLAGVALASPPTGGVQFNNGSNGFLADTDFLWDTASGTLQIGLAGSRAGKIDLRGAVSGSVRLTVDQPAANPITYQFGNALPSTNDLWRAANVTGNTVTLGFVAPGSLGFASVNPTSTVLPYNNAGTFADSPLRRIGASEIGFGSGANDVGIKQDNTFANNTCAVMAAGTTTGGNFVCRTLYFASVPSNSNTIIGGFVQANNVSRWNTSFEFGWTATASGAGNPVAGSNDVGLTRRTTNVLRVTSGGAGAGQLLLGTSTGTAQGRLHVDAVTTGTIPLYLFCESGATQPAIEAVQAGSLCFRAGQTGKLQGAANLVQIYSVIGNAKSDVATIGNVGTGVDNLLSFVIVGNSLNNTGDYCEFDAFGEFENNANNKTLKIVYGATTIFNTGAVAFGTAALANWRINCKIFRTGATAQKCITTFWSNDATTPFLQEIFITGENNAINRTVQFTGEATSNDDIIQYLLESRVCVAQTS